MRSLAPRKPSSRSIRDRRPPAPGRADRRRSQRPGGVCGRFPFPPARHGHAGQSPRRRESTPTPRSTTSPPQAQPTPGRSRQLPLPTQRKSSMLVLSLRRIRHDPGRRRPPLERRTHRTTKSCRILRWMACDRRRRVPREHRKHTQEAAHAEARRLAENAGGGEVRIHGMDGQIRESDTIAKSDPFPPRG